jgi:hypothetical protein
MEPMTIGRVKRSELFRGAVMSSRHFENYTEILELLFSGTLAGDASKKWPMIKAVVKRGSAPG